MSETRRTLHRLRDQGRDSARWRVRGCGVRRVSSDVQICTTDGHHHASGVMTCGSAWECAVCAAKIRMGRADEIKDAATRQRDRGGEVYLATLTIRHQWGDSLEGMRRAMGRAWRHVIRGRPWQEVRRLYGIEGYVRGLELTHGANGWHPHFHFLIFAKVELTPQHEAWLHTWLTSRWQRAVMRELGPSQVPSHERAVDIRVSYRDDYLCKLGLEITGALKTGANGHRSQWQLLADGDDTRWREYSAEMKGARAITWSRDIRVNLGMGAQVSDEELAALAEGLDPECETEDVARIAGRDWDAYVRACSPLALFASASGGLDGVCTEIARVLGHAAAARCWGLTKFGHPPWDRLPNPLHSAGPSPGGQRLDLPNLAPAA